MPRFSVYFDIKMTQRQLDFVDIDNECDLPVYVDPYAIEVRNDLWATQASEYIRVFFGEVLDAIRSGNPSRSAHLMSHLTEPRETFLGVASGLPQGRGVGLRQAQQLIGGIRKSNAFKSGILSDLSEMALYVEGVDRDKISDLTTNIIRKLLVEYTQRQCDLYNIATRPYIGPPMWSMDQINWLSEEVMLPFIEQDPVILVPKYIVRRKLSLDSQEFYNRQLTDLFIAEHLRANDSLVHVIRKKGKEERRVFKGEVRQKHPKSKNLIADTIEENPHLLDLYKEIAKRQLVLEDFGSDKTEPTLPALCSH